MGKPLIIKWRTNTYGERIRRIECTRETAAFVWVLEKGFSIGRIEDGLVERKLAKADSIYDTWDLAHAALLKSAEQLVLSARNRLAKAHDELGNVKGLRKPPGA